MPYTDERDDELDADSDIEPQIEDDDDLSDELEEEFPLGDGTADTESVVTCPYCAQEIEIGLDPGGGSMQQYVEDCQVCCQPWTVNVSYLEDGTAEVWVAALEQ